MFRTSPPAGIAFEAKRPWPRPLGAGPGVVFVYTLGRASFGGIFGVSHEEINQYLAMIGMGCSMYLTLDDKENDSLD